MAFWSGAAYSIGVTFLPFVNDMILMKQVCALLLLGAVTASVDGAVIFDNLSQNTFQQFPYQTGHNVLTTGGYEIGNAINLTSAGYVGSVEFAVWHSFGPGPVEIRMYHRVSVTGGDIVGALIGSRVATIPSVPSGVISTLKIPLALNTPTQNVYFTFRGMATNLHILAGGSPIVGTGGIKFASDTGSGFQYYGPLDMTMKIDNDPVPEPEAWLALGAGLLAVCARRIPRGA